MAPFLALPRRAAARAFGGTPVIGSLASGNCAFGDEGLPLCNEGLAALRHVDSLTSPSVR
jgi:hypothetical protein